MAIINDTAGDEAGVEASPVNALRVVEVNSAGTILRRPVDGDYTAVMAIAPTTLVDGTAYAAIFNASTTKRVFLKSIDVVQGYFAAAVASRSAYRLTRFAGNAPTGVAPLTPVPQSSLLPASVVQQFGLDTGLTVAGLEARFFHAMQMANQPNVTYEQGLDFDEPLILQPSQGIVLSALGAITSGSFITCTLRWSEGN